MPSAPAPYMNRLRKEYIQMKKNPPPHIVAAPLATNILEWHYVVHSLEGCPYAGGYYHGKLVFPKQYPYKPPSIMMITPNGRFKCNTRLCLSMSDFHPDQWNPAWSVESILKGLVSFMLENTPTVGSLNTSDAKKRMHANESGAINLRDAIFQELFPEMCDRIQKDLADRPQSVEAASKATGDASSQAKGAKGGGDSPAAGLGLLVAVVVFAYVVSSILQAVP
eukprot:m.206765 g.206765  ORF g.206765 m.206765 type:complete len:223 (+) comp18506_c1_seq2:344-1012(+)